MEGEQAMTDLLARLRRMGWAECHEAADEIERLHAENARLRGHNERLQADIDAIKRYG